jgi:hypothetical protein
MARIATALGYRETAVKVLNHLSELFESDQQLGIDEPFLAVSPRFEHLDPGEQMGDWCLAGILEEREKLQAFSSYYGGQGSLPSLEILKNLRFQGAEMERRRQLIRMRLGLQKAPEAAPVLNERGPENLNATIWMSKTKLFKG